MPTPKRNSDEIKSENQKALPRDRKGLGSAHASRAGAQLSRPVRLLAVGPGHSRQMLRVHESHCKILLHKDIYQLWTHGARPASRGGHMPIEDEDRPRKKISHEIGQDLSLLSVEELTERIALMNSEIERLQQAVTKKRASKDAANSFFKS